MERFNIFFCFKSSTHSTDLEMFIITVLIVIQNSCNIGYNYEFLISLEHILADNRPAVTDDIPKYSFQFLVSLVASIVRICLNVHLSSLTSACSGCDPFPFVALLATNLHPIVQCV